MTFLASVLCAGVGMSKLLKLPKVFALILLAAWPQPAALAKSKLPPCEVIGQVGDWFVLARGLYPSVKTLSTNVIHPKGRTAVGANVGLSRILDATQPDPATGEPATDRGHFLSVILEDPKVSGGRVPKETSFELYRLPSDGGERVLIGKMHTYSDWDGVVFQVVGDLLLWRDLTALSDGGPMKLEVLFKRKKDTKFSTFATLEFSTFGMADAVAAIPIYEKKLNAMIEAKECDLDKF